MAPHGSLHYLIRHRVYPCDQEGGGVAGLTSDPDISLLRGNDRRE